MHWLAIVLGWVFIFAGVALGAVVLESIVYYRRRRREERLYRQMRIDAPEWRHDPGLNRTKG